MDDGLRGLKGSPRLSSDEVARNPITTSEDRTLPQPQAGLYVQEVQHCNQKDLNMHPKKLKMIPQQVLIQSTSVDSHDPSVLAVDIEEAGRRISVGRSAIYELIKAGKIRTVPAGRKKRVVPIFELERYLKDNVA